METYNYGETPEKVIIAAAEKKLSSDAYEIECHEGTEDFEAIQLAVNQGIDAHLTAVFFEEFEGHFGKRGFRFDPKSLAVLCRRLGESEDENSQDLRSAILSTLDIEEI